MKCYVSTLSLWPYSMGKNGPFRAVEMSNQAELEGLQLLPLIGWNNFEQISQILEERVIAFEGDWREESFVKTVKKIADGDLAAMLIPFLFGSKNYVKNTVQLFKMVFSNAYMIDVDGEGENALREIDPKKDWEKGTGLVLDTYHVLELEEENTQIRGIEFLLGNLIDVYSHRIKLIHFQVRKESLLKEFLCGDGGYLHDVMSFLKDQLSERSIVIEIPPQWEMERHNKIELLRLIKAKIEKI